MSGSLFPMLSIPNIFVHHLNICRWVFRLNCHLYFIVLPLIKQSDVQFNDLSLVNGFSNFFVVIIPDVRGLAFSPFIGLDTVSYHSGVPHLLRDLYPVIII